MGHKISYATAGFKDRDIEAALDAIAAAGFDSVELLSKEPHIPTPLTGEALTGFTRRLYERGLSARRFMRPWEGVCWARRMRRGVARR